MARFAWSGSLVGVRSALGLGLSWAVASGCGSVKPSGMTDDAGNVIDAGNVPVDAVPGPTVQSLEVTSFPRSVASLVEPLRYRMTLNRGGTPSYALLDSPAGAAVDKNGYVTWLPGSADEGKRHVFRVRVDLDSQSVTQRFRVQVPKLTTAKTGVVGGSGQTGPKTVTVESPLSSIAGAGVVAPEGAIASPLELAISEVSGTATVPASQVDPELAASTPLVVDLGPTGAVFGTPVKVVVPISGVAAKKAGENGGKVDVWTLPSGGATWRRLETEHVDLEGGLVVTETSHFSQFIALPEVEILSDPVVTTGGKCATTVFATAQLGLALNQVKSAWFNGVEDDYPADLAAALTAIASGSLLNRNIKLVYTGELTLADGSALQAGFVVHVGREEEGSTLVVRVAKRSGELLLEKTGLGADSAELAAILRGAASHLAFAGIADPGQLSGSLTLAVYGYFTEGSDLGLPTSLGSSFDELTAQVSQPGSNTDDADCDRVRGSYDTTPDADAPPVCVPVSQAVLSTVIGDPVDLQIAVEGSGSPTVEWSSELGMLTPGDRTATFTATAAGTYQISAVVSAASGSDACSFTVLVEDATVSANTPPTCRISASSTGAFVGDTVELEAVGSDPEQGSEHLTYSWAMTGSGASLSGNAGGKVTLSGQAAGDYEVSCTASDGIDAGNAGTLIISVSERPANVPPVLDFISPVSNAREIGPGELVNQVIFAQGHDPDGDALSFQFELVSGSDTGLLLAGTDAAGSAERTLQVSAAGVYQVRVRVRDAKGASSTPLLATLYVTDGVSTVDADGDGFPLGYDCADADASVHPGAAEVCGDGLDQDCSGADLPAGDCDADGDGYSQAQGDCNDADVGVSPEAFEFCDGLDNNCDGQIDEFYQVGASCSAGVGACLSTAVLTCNRSGTAAICPAVAGTPGSESCNDLDDDCNGVTDDIGAGGGTTLEDCGGCNQPCTVDPAHHLSAACTPDDGGVYGCQYSCQPGFHDLDGDPSNGCEYACTPSTEVCDNADNDCDGFVDEDTTLYFYSGPAGTAGVGECRQGTQVCVSGEMTVVTAEVVPGAEGCDGLDNDCDGQADESFPTQGEACSVGTGACQASGGLVCVGGRVTCSAVAGQPQTETCDSVDNDCDGQADESFPTQGDSCSVGTGACQASGSYICSGGQVACDAVAGQPTSEVCDGVDNDCNGQTDETFPTQGDPCSVGTGACQASGSYVCNAGQVACSAVAGQPQSEICDSVDNDCNGQTDETFPGQGTACTVGVGACQASGVRVCTAGGEQCQGTPGQPQTEVCSDGIDNDCNGQTDETGCVNPGEDCGSAIEISLASGTPVTGDVSGYQDDHPASCLPTQAGYGQDVVYHFTVSSPTFGVFDTRNSPANIGFFFKDGAQCGVAPAPGEHSDCMLAGQLHQGDLEPGSYYVTVRNTGPGPTGFNFVLRECVDADGDKHASAACGGDDCDDGNPAVHAGALEVCGDGVDNDCNGQSDEAADNDQDGSLHPSCGGDDCNDMESRVHPGAAEVCGDMLDNDCDTQYDEPGCTAPTAGDNCAYTLELALDQTHSGTVDGFYPDVPGGCYGSENGGENGGDVVYHYMAQQPMSVVFDPAGSSASVAFSFLANACPNGNNHGCTGGSEGPRQLFLEQGHNYIVVKRRDPGPGNYSFVLTACVDADNDGHCAGAGDCNDGNAQVHQGAPEMCGDGLDNDCNGQIDEAADNDRDGVAAVACGGTDCDDFDWRSNPAAPELCGDGKDQNCNGEIDEPGCTTLAAGETCGNPVELDLFASAPQTGTLTGYGNDVQSGCYDNQQYGEDKVFHFVLPEPMRVVLDARATSPQVGFATTSGSCGGGGAGGGSGGSSGGGTSMPPADGGFGYMECAKGGELRTMWLGSGEYFLVLNRDGSGTGDFNFALAQCLDSDGDGHCAGYGDCNDSNRNVHPGSPEVCGDGLDNDCDGQADEPSDFDGDGYLDASCSGGNDCNDRDPTVWPGAPELCPDALDNDCDGQTDEPGCQQLPAGETCGNAHPVNLVTGSHFTGTLSDNVKNVFGGCFDRPDLNEDEVFRFVASPEVPVALDLRNTGPDVAFELRYGGCDGGGAGECMRGGEVRRMYLGGGEFYLVARRDGPGTGNYDFTIGNCVDGDSDGYCGNADDCDDANPQVHPGPNEVCGDGIDNNCNGQVDEPGDKDGDGYPDAACSGGTDCNDLQWRDHPGAAELCSDGRDNDCNGQTDEDPCTALAPGETCANPEDLDVFASGPPVTGTLAGFGRDVEGTCGGRGEGYGEDRVYRFQLSSPTSVVLQTEGTSWDVVFSGMTNGCPGMVGDCASGGETRRMWLPAGEHFLVLSRRGPGGDFSFSLRECVDGDADGYCDGAGDCNDANPSVHQGAPETCGDGVDNNCDGQIDEPHDFDYDGATDAACAGGTDCNDNDPSVHPGATELCPDGQDNDCDGQADEPGCQEMAPGETCGNAIEVDLVNGGNFAGALSDNLRNVYGGCYDSPYSGEDEVFHFTVASPETAVVLDTRDTGPGVGFSLLRDSCPGGMTWDCTEGGQVRKMFLSPGSYYLVVRRFDSGPGSYDFTLGNCVDADGDGHCGNADDCNDAASGVHPGAPELCGDGIDQNCNGQVDEPGDADADGYPDGACGGTDCNDGNWRTHPGAPELCGDGTDNNCNGQSDEDPCEALAAGETCGNPQELDIYASLPPETGTLNGYGRDIQGGCFDYGGPQNVDRIYRFTVASPTNLVLQTQGTDSEIGFTTLRDQCPGGPVDQCVGAGETRMMWFPAGTHYLVVKRTGMGSNFSFTLRQCVDGDGDGWCEGVGDCNDGDPGVHPGAYDMCGDGIDQNCNGQADEPQDGDGDGYSDVACAGGTDCNDQHPGVHPGAVEVCPDALDNDCDGVADEAGCTELPPGETCGNAISVDLAAGASVIGNLTGNTRDVFSGCYSGQPDVEDEVYSFTATPGVPVVLDARSTTSNIAFALLQGSCPTGPSYTCMNGGQVNKMYLDGGTHYLVVRRYAPGSADYNFLLANCVDGDGDGACGNADDCDDANPQVYPWAYEQCDGLDNNCNGQVDEAQDQDGDGHAGCGGPDCNDNDWRIHPGRQEVCGDTLDNDCDGAADEAGCTELALGEACFNPDVLDVVAGAARSGSLTGSSADTLDQCGYQPNHPDRVLSFQLPEPGLVVFNSEGSDSSINFELMADSCQGAFLGCSWGSGQQSMSLQAGTYYLLVQGDASAPSFYQLAISLCTDVDGDGHAAASCGGNDCNDDNPGVHPGVPDCADGVDNNCNGVTDGPGECFCADGDGDGFPNAACGGDDCADNNPMVYPGAPEMCGNGLDENCNGVADGPGECPPPPPPPPPPGG